MITANPELDMAQFMTVFNQVFELHSAHILAIAEREMSSSTLTDLTMIDKDDVFEEEWQPSQVRSKGNDPNSGNADAQQVNTVTQEQNQINYATQIQNLALSMFDRLSSLRKDNSDSKSEDVATAAIPSSPNQVTDAERDLKLARDCRELLQVKGKDDGNNLIFERPDGKGTYKFSLEKASDTMTLNAKDRPVNPILVESQGTVVESHVTDLDAANIARAVELLNAQQTKPLENQK
ncbi:MULTISPECIES: hypothetical protein [Pseudanabaena]|uniref:Uncharacterized protein n=2 Tax=Pseudanabaena TaxID=1152 RepID=L8N3P7_9CYAN|nr:MULTISPECIES: hypothetical protein [Pseudanabaena]ELS34867.1 hypothetical protein Pse7429DRAFT_0056 [Pseudanabaena biceps PCC 7429]MDG3492986.1 hypothetical protein [Pseudanabaena catenata USMAC16]